MSSNQTNKPNLNIHNTSQNATFKRKLMANDGTKIQKTRTDKTNTVALLNGVKINVNSKLTKK